MAKSQGLAKVTNAKIVRLEDGRSIIKDDLIVTEEPLEIRLVHWGNGAWEELKISITMRTPGNDHELALGFLLSENIVKTPADVTEIYHCKQVKAEEQGNVVKVVLEKTILFDKEKLDRNFISNSSCGVCGKGSLEALEFQCKRITEQFVLEPKLIAGLPRAMRKQQTVFQHTGGLHAAAVFNKKGELLLLREDVGRHNAVDKICGALSTGKYNTGKILVLSGRIGFELVQKAAVAGIPVIVAVGAPTSLAIQLAHNQGLTLIGFARGNTFNVYSGAERVATKN